MKEVVIYTDGACSGNPGPGGWAAVLLSGKHRLEISGAEKFSTNQRMELMGAVSALEALKAPCVVSLYSDSAYLINAFQQNWFNKWLSNGWLNSRKQPVEHSDLWKKLWQCNSTHRVTWVKIPGHSGNIENERCDVLAKEAIRGLLTLD